MNNQSDASKKILSTQQEIEKEILKDCFGISDDFNRIIEEKIQQIKGEYTSQLNEKEDEVKNLNKSLHELKKEKDELLADFEEIKNLYENLKDRFDKNPKQRPVIEDFLIAINDILNETESEQDSNQIIDNIHNYLNFTMHSLKKYGVNTHRYNKGEYVSDFDDVKTTIEFTSDKSLDNTVKNCIRIGASFNEEKPIKEEVILYRYSLDNGIEENNEERLEK